MSEYILEPSIDIDIDIDIESPYIQFQKYPPAKPFWLGPQNAHAGTQG